MSAQKTTQSAKQVINAKVAAAKAVTALKVAEATKTVVPTARIAAAQQAIEQAFSTGEALNKCNTIKMLTRNGFTPLEIIAATGLNKVTVYRQSAEAVYNS